MAGNHNVLYQGVDDFTPVAGDAITITSVGSNAAINDGTTSSGATLTINNNGTPSDPSDDFVVYTPPTGFSGTDTYSYIITNNGGATDTARVTVVVTTCGSGFVEDTTLVAASAQSNNVGVNNAANVLGAADDSFAEWFTGGDRINLDFGQVYAQGTRYRITWRARSGNTNARPVIRESTTNGSFTDVVTAYNIPDNTTISTLVTSENSFRFLQIEKVNAVNGVDFEIDAIEVLDIACIEDGDNDGVIDLLDIDDDNDGILDADECGTARQVNVFTFTGADQTYNVPAGASQITAKIWGAGGRGDTQSGRGVGGAGGFTEFVIPVSSLTSTTLIVMVGEGGNSSTGSRTYGNGGAGLSTFFDSGTRNYGAGGGMSAISYTSLTNPDPSVMPIF